MKKFISILIVFVLILCISSCSIEKQALASIDNLPDNSQNELEYTVTVSGAEIYNDHAVLPLCRVLESLGFRLKWNGNNIAMFVCNEIEYEISLSGTALTKTGGDDNYLICAPGNRNFVCNASAGDLMVDDNTVKCLFQSFLEYPVSISIDRDNDRVIISKK